MRVRTEKELVRGIWREMNRRCHQANSPDFIYYGWRGIAVCISWRYDFLKFMSDMGPRPARGYSLDRINNDLGYEPSNCRWATRADQARNRRSTKLSVADAEYIRITYRDSGESQSAIAQRLGTSQGNVSDIIRLKKWRS